MTEYNKEKLLRLESKIENMLDKLIESDEDLENNGDNSSLKFSEDISSSEENKNENEPFEKELFSKPFFPNENKVQPKESKLIFKSSIDIFNEQNTRTNLNQNNFSNTNLLYNSSNYFPFNYSYSQQTNNNMNNKSNSNLFGSVYKMANNNINHINNESLNTTTSFTSNFDNNNNVFPMINNSYMNYGYHNFNNSFCYENNKSFFNRNKKSHNSFFAGDKICFNNKKIMDTQNNYKINALSNDNVELEILLIEVNKILSKIEKIDQAFFNKLKGKFEQIIRTHKGSRIFQNYLKNTHIDILHQIFLEIKSNLSDLLRDNYANYFCKKFFDYLNQKDRIEFLKIIQNDLKYLAIDITATYPIQGIIEQVGSKVEKNIIYMGIKDSISKFCYNIYGTHVIEKILGYFEDEFTKEIIDYIYNNFIDLAFNINGICVVKKLLLMTHKKDLHNKLKQKVNDNALKLIVHQYGNYVIQIIFENWDNNELQSILNYYKNNQVLLSKLKYSSNAIERIIEKNKNNLDDYINEICIGNNISELILNNYGNYVIQKALKLSTGKSKDILIQNILKNLCVIDDQKISNKWKNIISSKLSH